MHYLCVIGTVLLTTYGQLVLKWRLSRAGSLPDPLVQKLLFLLRQFHDPWILSGFVAAAFAALCWMAALTRLELSHAYPFMGLSFVAVLCLSSLLLGETITTAKALGIALIVAGVAVIGAGS